MLFFKSYFSLFFIYSILGWFMEVVWTFIMDKKIINRGFMIGPYCPIYGVGCLMLVFFLNSFKNNIYLLFLMSVVICSILEYFTSFIMEKLFNARWWDYSDLKFNLNGRICARTMIPFGFLGVFVVSILNPYLLSLVDFSSFFVLIFFMLFVIDLCVSFKVIENISGTISIVSKDCTEEISKKVRELVFSQSFFHKRLVNAFPSLKSPFEIIKDIVHK
jgi:uncharacterized membrane protein